MKVNFRSLELKNFLSFGDNVTELSFTSPGLIALRGKNGHGKSSIVDALSFVLFGKPYRKIKINELINRTNKNNLYVRVTFKAKDTNYRITRTLKPNSITVEKMIDGEYVEQELLSGNKLIQDELNSILGIEYKTFKHIVSISAATTSSKPFLTMSAYDKRNLIESIFNLDAISEMNKELKADKSKNNVALLNATSNVSMYTRLIEQQQTSIEKNEYLLDNFEKDKLQAIKDYEEKKEKISDGIAKLEETIEKINSSLPTDAIDTFKAKAKLKREYISELNTSIGTVKGQMKALQASLDNFTNLNVCPVCNQTVDKDHIDTEVNNLTHKLKEEADKYTDLTAKLKRAKDDLDTIEKNIQDVNVIVERIQKYVNDKTNLETHLELVEKQIKEKENESLDIDTNSLREELDNLTHSLELSNTALADAKEKEMIIELAGFLLSDKGIKTEFYNIIVPLLNKTVNEYITSFNLPIVISFDSDFNISIMTVKEQSNNVNYYSFSEGEKRRMEVAILLSFIKLSKSIANWNCNILIFDEIVDQNVDNEGLMSMLYSIKEIAQDEQLHAIVVSHKELDKDIFDSTILITKDAIFSKLLII